MTHATTPGDFSLAARENAGLAECMALADLIRAVNTSRVDGPEGLHLDAYEDTGLALCTTWKEVQSRLDEIYDFGVSSNTDNGAPPSLAEHGDAYRNAAIAYLKREYGARGFFLPDA